MPPCPPMPAALARDYQAAKNVAARRALALSPPEAPTWWSPKGGVPIEGGTAMVTELRVGGVRWWWCARVHDGRRWIGVSEGWTGPEAGERLPHGMPQPPTPTLPSSPPTPHEGAPLSPPISKSGAKTLPELVPLPGVPRSDVWRGHVLVPSEDNSWMLAEVCIPYEVVQKYLVSRVGEPNFKAIQFGKVERWFEGDLFELWSRK